MNLAADVFDQAKLFFALPDQEKMEVCTDLMPDEFCGYHPMHRYNINQSQKKGQSCFQSRSTTSAKADMLFAKT